MKSVCVCLGGGGGGGGGGGLWNPCVCVCGGGGGVLISQNDTVRVCEAWITLYVVYGGQLGVPAFVRLAYYQKVNRVYQLASRIYEIVKSKLRLIISKLLISCDIIGFPYQMIVLYCNWNMHGHVHV